MVYGDLSSNISVEWADLTPSLKRIGKFIGGWGNLRVNFLEEYDRGLDTICVKTLNQF